MRKWSYPNIVSKEGWWIETWKYSWFSGLGDRVDSGAIQNVENYRRNRSGGCFSDRKYIACFWPKWDSVVFYYTYWKGIKTRFQRKNLMYFFFPIGSCIDLFRYTKKCIYLCIQLDEFKHEYIHETITTTVELIDISVTSKSSFVPLYALSFYGSGLFLT